MTFQYVPNPSPGDIDRIVSEWVHRELTNISDLLSEVYPRWEDLRFPAVSLKPGGTAPNWNDTTGQYEVAVGEYIWATIQLPHAWKVGTVLKPHVHWNKITSAAGNVNWQLDYKWWKIGEVIDAAYTTLSDESPDISDGDTAYQHALTSLGDIIPASDTEISDCLICKLSRVAAAGTEYGADSGIIEFDIHYEIDSVGSQLEFIKDLG